MPEARKFTSDSELPQSLRTCRTSSQPPSQIHIQCNLDPVPVTKVFFFFFLGNHLIQAEELMSASPECLSQQPCCALTVQPLLSAGHGALTADKTITTLTHLPFLYPFLPWSRFFRPSAPIMGDKTNRKRSYYLRWGNMGKVITQSWNLVSGFHKLLYQHPAPSHPRSSTLAGEASSVWFLS